MIRAQTKRIIRARYVLRCGYCTVAEQEIGAELTYDHFKPISLGGSDDIENIVYACHSCNAYKSDFWHEDESARLLHPLHDDFADHIREIDGGILIGLSVRGENHIQQLHLNRSALVALRSERKLGAQSREDMHAMRELLHEILRRLDAHETRNPN